MVFIVILSALLSLTIFASWLTHVCICIKANKWGILIAGILFFPIAIIHGIGIWLGKFSTSPEPAKIS